MVLLFSLSHGDHSSFSFPYSHGVHKNVSMSNCCPFGGVPLPLLNTTFPYPLPNVVLMIGVQKGGQYRVSLSLPPSLPHTCAKQQAAPTAQTKCQTHRTSQLTPTPQYTGTTHLHNEMMLHPGMFSMPACTFHEGGSRADMPDGHDVSMLALPSPIPSHPDLYCPQAPQDPGRRYQKEQHFFDILPLSAYSLHDYLLSLNYTSELSKIGCGVISS